MAESVMRSLTILLLGCTLLVVAFLMLDVELTKRTIGLFVVLPIGALFVAFGLWAVTRAFLADE